jgi:hypothetical protein
MARSAKGASERRTGGGIRPALLAGGVALMWFVEFQTDPMLPDTPSWGVALVLGGRLLADFVCAVVAVSIVRLVLAAARAGIANWLLARQRGDE